MRQVFTQTFDVAPEPLVTLSVPGEPYAAARVKFNRQQGHAYTPAPYREAREALSWALRAAYKGEPCRDYLVLDVVFVMATKRPKDEDNLHKTVLDAGNRIVWHDDRQFVGGQWLIAYDPERPRLDLTVWRLIGEAP